MVVDEGEVMAENIHLEKVLFPLSSTARVRRLQGGRGDTGKRHFTGQPLKGDEKDRERDKSGERDKEFEAQDGLYEKGVKPRTPGEGAEKKREEDGDGHGKVIDIHI